MTTPYSLNHELRPLVKIAVQNGWSLSACGSGHVRLRGPKGETIVISNTKIGSRVFRNVRAQLRRAGCPV